MNEIILIVAALFAGLLLGCFFFAGLWWTVRKGVAAKNPALWFAGSFVVRTAVVMAGFYLAARHGWLGWLPAVLGFAIARLMVLRFTRLKSKAGHAP